MYGNVQRWYQLQKNFCQATPPHKVSELHNVWVKLQVTASHTEQSYESIQESFFTNCALKCSEYFTVSFNFKCTVKSMMIHFQIDSPSSLPPPPPSSSHPSNITSSFGRAEQKKRVLEQGRVQYSCYFINPILCTPSPQIKTITILGKMTKRRESKNRKQTFNFNCSDYCANDKL